MTKIYVTFLVLAAAGVLASLTLSSSAAFLVDEILPFTIFVVTIAVAHQYAFRMNDGKLSYSLAFILLLTALLIFPPVLAVYCAAGGVAVFELSRKTSAISVGWFNVSQVTLSTAGASLLYRWILSIAPAGLAWQLAALLAASCLLTLSNQVFSGIYLALRSQEPIGKSLWSILSSTMAPDDLLVSPLALFAAGFYSEVGIAGLVAIFLPLLLLRHAYGARVKIQRGMEDLLRVLVKTLETRDRYTSGHSVRVSVLARSIAEDMGLRPRQVKQAEQAALVHDIGKIEEVYAEIIMKPHTLSDVEKLVIRTHATRGADFLKSLSSFPDEVILGVRHHHERYDGKGYPDGQIGEAIPLISRIIMICDSVDAMLSDRPYRKALPVSTVREELQRFAGSQFDPKLVEVMLAKGTLERAVELLRDAYPSREEEEDAARVIQAAHRFKEATSGSTS